MQVLAWIKASTLHTPDLTLDPEWSQWNLICGFTLQVGFVLFYFCKGRQVPPPSSQHLVLKIIGLLEELQLCLSSLGLSNLPSYLLTQHTQDCLHSFCILDQGGGPPQLHLFTQLQCCSMRNYYWGCTESWVPQSTWNEAVKEPALPRHFVFCKENLDIHRRLSWWTFMSHCVCYRKAKGSQ